MFRWARWVREVPPRCRLSTTSTTARYAADPCRRSMHGSTRALMRMPYVCGIEHTCLRACLRTSMHIFLHTWLHSSQRACVHSCLHACLQSCEHTCQQGCLYAHPHTYLNSYGDEAAEPTSDCSALLRRPTLLTTSSAGGQRALPDCSARMRRHRLRRSGRRRAPRW